jgi:hypothetical protein
MFKSLPRLCLEITGRSTLSYLTFPFIRLYWRNVIQRIHWEGLTYVKHGLRVAISIHGESISHTLHVTINLLNNPIDVLLFSCKIVEGLRDFSYVYQVLISWVIFILEILIVLLELVLTKLKEFFIAFVIRVTWEQLESSQEFLELLSGELGWVEDCSLWVDQLASIYHFNALLGQGINAVV